MAVEGDGHSKGTENIDAPVSGDRNICLTVTFSQYCRLIIVLASEM
jgi:hypothetical protein